MIKTSTSKFVLIANNPDLRSKPDPVGISPQDYTIIRFNACRNIHLFNGKTDIVCFRTAGHPKPVRGAILLGITKRIIRSLFGPHLYLHGTTTSLRITQKAVVKYNKNVIYFIVGDRSKVNPIIYAMYQVMLNRRIKHSIDHKLFFTPQGHKFATSSGVSVLIWLTKHFPNAEIILLGFNLYKNKSNFWHNFDIDRKIVSQLWLRHNITILNVNPIDGTYQKTDPATIW